jgi:hypothetical protein
MQDPLEPELPKPTPTLKFGFGVGCAQFVPKNRNDEFSSFEEYISELKKSLGGISALRDVSIQAEDRFKNFETGVPSPFPRLDDGEFPSFSQQHGIQLRIYLQLSIPARTQKSLMRLDDGAKWEGFSNISVFIISEYACPIMIVRVSHDDLADPSDAVMIVRKFLEGELEGNKNCRFSFDTIGPSPFHADFNVYQVAGSVSKYSFETSIKRGYDEINYYVTDTASEKISMNHKLFRDLIDELDLFYSIKIYSVELTREWNVLFKKVRVLQTDRKNRPIVKRIIWFFFPPFSVYDIISDIADFRLMMVSAASSIKERISNDPLVKQSPIWTIIKREWKNAPEFDIETIEKLVDYVDRRQARHHMIINAIMAAIVGGVVGGLVRLWP